MLYFKIIALTAILFFINMETGRTQVEHQEYALVQKFPGFEVRYYPPAVMAKVYSEVKTYKEIGSPGFRTLAGYIFGGNSTGEKIAMTAPVYIDLEEKGSSMSFVMPSEYSLIDLPVPGNPAVHIEPVDPVYVAVITFGGYANDNIIKEQSLKLEKLLKDNNIRQKGNFRYMGYNSPYKIWNRRNEIAAEIIWE
jgi:hypothetical protein